VLVSRLTDRHTPVSVILTKTCVLSRACVLGCGCVHAWITGKRRRTAVDYASLDAQMK